MIDLLTFFELIGAYLDPWVLLLKNNFKAKKNQTNRDFFIVLSVLAHKKTKILIF